MDCPLKYVEQEEHLMPDIENTYTTLEAIIVTPDTRTTY
jgi:hypothetical protein